MWKRLLFSSLVISSLSACGERTAILVTVQIDPAIADADDIRSLRVMLNQQGDSASVVFDNDGEPINFPVTLSTRVDAARRGDINVSVAGLNAVGNSIVSGVNTLNLNGGELQEVAVEMAFAFPEDAGDGIDSTSCLDLIDNDANGLTDCQEEACQQLLPEQCAGAVCGDGVPNPFALEHCDDGNNNNADDCDNNCVSNNEQFTGFLEFGQIVNGQVGNADISFAIDNPLQTKEGFVTLTPAGNGDCSRLAFLTATVGDPGVQFFFAEYGAWEMLDEAGAVVHTVTPTLNGPTFFDINNGPLYQSGQPFSSRFLGNTVDEFAPFVAPREIFPLTPFPTQLLVPEDPANLTAIRGQDFVVTWPNGTPGEDAIIFLFSGAVEIICKVPSDDGSVTIPGELTASLSKGAGFGLQIANGFLETVAIPADETVGLTGDDIDSNIILIVENGTTFSGIVE
jgi:hypothetical protein